jgi:glucose-1-phosphate thymidylyltransferase
MVLDDLEPSVDIVESDGNRFEGRLDIHPSVYVRGSVLHGPAVIGEGAEIVDAYVGPYTTIGRGVHIEGAEIERSIVYEGATIQHLGVRVQDSTVGAHARIVREFGLPRAMRVHVGEGVELALD